MAAPGAVVKDGVVRMVDPAAQREALGGAIEEALDRVLSHGNFVLGPEVAELERRLAAWIGVEHCISTASGTASLEMVLRALDIGPGDEVVTVPFTWVSTAAAIRLVGARPVFVDIDSRTFDMDMDRVERALTPATRALLPVSLFGHMADLSRALDFGLPVIEDGAQSFGAGSPQGRSCSRGTAGCTSFYPTKPLGCYGEGGAVFTRDPDLADRLRHIRVHGESRRFRHSLLGTNGRFDTLQAAVLLAKLPAFPAELRRRREIAAAYDRALEGLCRTPVTLPGHTHAFAQYTIRVPDRDAFREHLSSRGIPSGVYYSRCLHHQPVFADLPHPPGGFPEAERAAREVVSLPVHPYLADVQVERIIAAATSFLRAWGCGESAAGRRT